MHVVCTTHSSRPCWGLLYFKSGHLSAIENVPIPHVTFHESNNSTTLCYGLIHKIKRFFPVIQYNNNNSNK